MAETIGAEIGNPAGVRKQPRIFYGWYVVFASAGMNLYGSGLWFYGFPIFYKALLDEFGWSAAAGAAVISLSRLEGGLEGPIIGWAVDKFGPRKLALIGGTIFGLGFLLMSIVQGFSIGPLHVNALAAFIFLYAGIMSVGRNTGFGHASMAAINSWFITKRSRAFAIYSLGAGGSGATVFALALTVDAFGWRSAAFLGGIGIFIIVLPLALVLRHKPEQYGYLPDGAEPEEVTATSTQVEGESPSSPKPDWIQYDFSLKETFLTLAFWMLILGFGARSVSMTSIVVHEVKYLTDVRGISAVQAGGALGGMVFISMIGRFGFGWFGDRIDKRYLFIATYLMQALGILILDTVSNMFMVWLFVVIYGIAYGGAIPLSFSIVGDYYGRKNYATIRGFMQMFLIPATLVGPIYAGLVFDLTSSYHIAFMSFIFSLLLGTVFIFLARKPKLPASALRAGHTSQ
ncbi:MAG: MFS transporter [Chloroflexi bacterium]|nr:MFS transporter [Chloroflexota bacterium]